MHKSPFSEGTCGEGNPSSRSRASTVAIFFAPHVLLRELNELERELGRPLHRRHARAALPLPVAGLPDLSRLHAARPSLLSTYALG